MAVLIDPPAAPLPSPGLLTAAVGPLPLPVHAMADGGIQYVLDTCGTAQVVPVACDNPPDLSTYEGSDGVLVAEPFAVAASSECGRLGTSDAETEARVRRRLQLKEQWAVERAFWGGNAEVPGYLQSNTVDTLDAVPTGGVTAAISVLEQALADNYGLPGLIHVRPRLAAYLGNAGQLRWDGQTARTQRGNVVVIGDGYSGEGPGGEDPEADGSTEWIYATGRVLVWREGEPFVPPVRTLFNRTNNQQRALAMRAYALGVECYMAAALVTVGEPV